MPEIFTTAAIRLVPAGSLVFLVLFGGKVMSKIFGIYPVIGIWNSIWYY